MKPYRSYQADLIKLLEAPEQAADYLNAVLEEGDQGLFLLALRNVIEAQGSMTNVAKLAGLNRVSLYKMLSGNGNPGFANILKLLKIVGVRFRMISIEKKIDRKAVLPSAVKSRSCPG